jgi:hypothetical protein
MDCPVCGVDLEPNEHICGVCGTDIEAWQEARAAALGVSASSGRSAGSRLAPNQAPPPSQAYPAYPAQVLPVGPPITAINRRILQPLGVALIVAGVVLGAFLVLAVLNKPPLYDAINAYHEDIQAYYPAGFLMVCALGPLLLLGGTGVLVLRLSRRR